MALTLTSADKKWIENKIVDGVLEGIHEVVMPALESLDKKIDIKVGKVSKQIDSLEAGFSRMERKLDTVIGHHADKLDQHENRLETLEGRMRLNVI